ncbi:MAG TPA: LysE family transporter [Microvirga sp.]|jgi:threonine/homoserine/homoserine lactone efflux protein|nr:LysE family transporter [Microvirga sp.]
MAQAVPSAGLWGPLASLLLAALVVMGSPGPSTTSLTAVGAAFGWRRALPYGAGLVAGTVAVLAAVATGVASALAAVPGLAPLLLAGSCLYILYLAVRIATAPPLSGAGTARAPSFAGGFGLAAANPKAWLAIAAVYSGTSLGLAPGAEAALKVAALTAMIVAIHAAWLVAGAALSRALSDPVLSRRINLAFAAILVVSTAMALL